MFRRSGRRFADENMRQIKNLERVSIPQESEHPLARLAKLVRWGNTMHWRAILAIVLGAISVGIAAQAAADEAACPNPNSPPAAGVTACSELIASRSGSPADQAKAYGWRGYHFSKLGEYDRAIADFTAAIPLFPNDAAVYNNRGLAYLAKGDVAKAHADFTEAIRLAPQFAEAYTNRGRAYELAHQLDDAIGDHTDAIRLDPRLARAYASRGLAYEAKGDRDRALNDVNAALAIDPKLQRAIEARNRLLAGAVASPAPDSAACEDPKTPLEAAIAACGDVIASAGASTAARAKALYARGVRLNQKRDYDAAIADFDAALKLSPNDAQIYRNRGSSYTNKGSFDAAIADLTEAIRLEPANAISYNNRGTAFLRKNEMTKAYADYTEAIRLNPRLAEPYTNRGRAYELARQFDDAIADHNEAIKLNPKLALAYANRGLAYEGKGERARALADFEAALAIDPNMQRALEGRDRMRAAAVAPQQPKPAEIDRQPPPAPAAALPATPGAARRAGPTIPDNCQQDLDQCSRKIWGRNTFPHRGSRQSVAFSNGRVLTCISNGRDTPRSCTLR
jgi:tetratricopeptide (TPR) repeat protein